METLARAANRGSISTGYDIDNSLKFEADNSEYLSRTPSSAGNRRTWTLSCWIKRTELASSASMQILSAGDTYLHFAGDRLAANFRSASENFFFGTNRVFRDTSAWYHIVLQCDTTQATATDRAKLWVNGEAQTADWLNSYDNMSQNYETLMNSTSEHEVGKYVNDESTYAEFFNGYMAEMHLVDGTALEPTDFGETDEDSGIWKPKAYTGSYGTNGFYLDFSDSANLGNDASGGLDFTETNITSADQATDTPTNNFCTLNANFTDNYVEAIALEGGTYMKRDGANNYASYIGTMGVTAGKWYWEFYIPSRSGTYGLIDYIGLHTIQGNGSNAAFSGIASSAFWLLHYGDYSAFTNGSLTSQNTEAGLPSVGTGGVGHTYGVAFNADAGEITFYDNGSLVGNAGIDIYDLHDDMGNGIFVLPFFQVYDNNLNCNFGGYSSVAISSAASDANGYGTFEYAPPTGYYALCTKNLAEFG
jgi:hypothetical protein